MEDLGIQTSQDARFYAVSSALAEPFSNKDQDLVLQFSVKHEQNIDCGGGYIKLLPASADLKNFDGETPYFVMFGPDICGPSNRRVHVIITYKGEHHLIKTTIQPRTDVFTHVYTLVIHPDQTYAVLIDQEEVNSGSLTESFAFLAPKMIKDPEASKPESWDERPKIADPEDVKPEGWDDVPEFIADPEATKPEDWDDDMDGDWEAPTISNPDYKGPWKARQIDNPNYQGVWVHPEIENPDYVHDAEIYKFDNIGAVGFDLWQVKSGTVFDNIIVATSLEEAKAFYEQTTARTIEGEKAAKKAHDDLEAKRLEEEEAKRKAAEADEDDDADDDEDDHARDEL